MTRSLRTAIGWLVFLSCLGILIHLGTWQLQRRDWKHSLIQEYQQNLTRPALTAIPQQPGLSLRPVRIQGHFTAHTPIAVYSVTPQGKSGFKHYAVFKPASGDTMILVQRGWSSGSEPVTFESPTQMTTLQGHIKTPPKPNRFTPTNQPDQNQWYSADLEAMAKHYKIAELTPYLFIEKNTNLTEIEANPEPTIDLPDNHLHYAMTWFTLALAWVFMFIFYQRKTSGANNDKRLSAT